MSRGATALLAVALALPLRLANAQALKTPAPAAPTEAAVSPVLTVGGASLTVSGFLQADAVAWSQASVDELDPSTGEPLNEGRFIIRRGRLRLDASRTFLSGAVEIDANTVKGPALRLLSAEASARWMLQGGDVPLVQVAVGLFRIPFGYDVRLNSRDRFFLEPSQVARALFPGDYDLGVKLRGGWRFLRYELAAMNGEPIGEAALPGRDPNAAKDFVGRIAAVGEIAHVVAFEVGFSGLAGTGFHPGSWATKDTVVWRDANEDGLVQPSELQVIAGAPATASQNYRRFALGMDARVGFSVPELGHFELAGEIAWASNLDRGLFMADPIAVGRDAREAAGRLASPRSCRSGSRSASATTVTTRTRTRAIRKAFSASPSTRACQRGPVSQPGGTSAPPGSWLSTTTTPMRWAGTRTARQQRSPAMR